MDITSDIKVGELAASNPNATRVLEQAGVDYCCGGHESLHDACMHAGVSEEEILTRLRENQATVGENDRSWLSAPLAELTEHIRTKHHGYVREAIHRIQPLAAKVKGRHGANHGELAGIEELFAQVAREMSAHMQKEEMILFPYIEGIERAANGQETIERPFFQTVRNPVHAMMQEHDAAAALVRQIREKSSGYQTPADGCMSYQALYRELQQFETDLHQHVHLENNILFPRAVELEPKVGLV
ncbi:MAG: iron-sulfur cluster repair di-iron protein [Acidobacteriota bacterium]|nr:iron-sulfur cluster repair di-iron protein [Acidobacteriota bacterium]MDE3169937.1 iron-sulfur cluster repair di-iron protein [Acidobacteriota bacterium]